MGKYIVPHADLDKAIKDKRYKPYLMRVCAVRAEVIERAKPHRDLTQGRLRPYSWSTCVASGSGPRGTLAEGLKGLRARGG